MDTPPRPSRSLPRVVLTAWLLLAPGSAAAVDVIVNASVEVTHLSQYKLRAVFGMRLPVWPNGTPVRVFVLKDDTDLHREFSKQILGVFPHQLRRAWDNLIYSGLGQAPVQADSEQELIEQVSKSPGAIGYATRQDENPHVRILLID